MIRKALIIAAGKGGRLVANGLGPPKPLIPVAGVPLLSHALLRLEAAGMEEACVVLGYRGEEIEAHYRQAPLHRLRVRWLPGANPNSSNGMSVLHARAALLEPFLLLMGDHLIEVEVLRRMARVALEPEGAVLAVDRKLDRVFDVEEATKVKLDAERIRAIGKQLSDYDAVDTGLFACSLGLWAALEASLRGGDCSLSDGIQELARGGRMRALDIREAEWVDIDTPEALAYAEKQIASGKFSLPAL